MAGSEGFTLEQIPGCSKGQNHVGTQMNTYKGRTALDVREFYCDNDGDELWHASPRGVRVPLQGARKFLAAVQQVVEDNASIIDAAEKEVAAAKPKPKKPKSDSKGK